MYHKTECLGMNGKYHIRPFVEEKNPDIIGGLWKQRGENRMYSKNKCVETKIPAVMMEGGKK